MSWYYVKLNEDDALVIYAYGWETKETTGKLMYDKNTKKVTVIKVADNDDEKSVKWAAGYLLDVVKNGYPEKKVIMIG